VLSGGTKQEDLKRYGYQPDLVVNSIADLYNQDFLQPQTSAA